jgi:hypothetical protein
MDFSTFAVPPCSSCGGVLKPDVVFYGENVPRDQVAAAQTRLESADAMLIVGSSLMVYSGCLPHQPSPAKRVKAAAPEPKGRRRASGPASYGSASFPSGYACGAAILGRKGKACPA